MMFGVAELVRASTMALAGRYLPVLGPRKTAGIGFGAAAMMLSEPDQSIRQNKKKRELAGGIMAYVLTPQFGFLFLGLFVATCASLLTLGNLKPILLGAGLNPAATTLGIALFAMGNAVGHIIWGQLHDRMGSRQTIVYSLLFMGIALVPLLFDMPTLHTLALIPVIGPAFGAAFVIYASSMVEYFGVSLFPRLSHMFPRIRPGRHHRPRDGSMGQGLHWIVHAGHWNQRADCVCGVHLFRCRPATHGEPRVEEPAF
jgi:hypothetical protein